MQIGSQRCEPRPALRDSPVLKGDLHVHSSYSYDVPGLPEFSPRALYDRAVAIGMGVFTLTDHDTMAGIMALQRELRDTYGDSPPIPALAGVELKVADPAVGHTVHINVLGLTEEQMFDLKGRAHSVDAFVGYCRRHSLFHVYNHPFWFERGERANLAAIEKLCALFPVIELNGGRIHELNERTEELASRHRKPVLAASDTHTGQIGKCFTAVSAADEQQFLAGIAAGAGRPCAQHMTFHELASEISHTVDLLLHGIACYSQLPLPKGIDRRTEFFGRLIGRRWLFDRPVTRRGLGTLFKLMARPPAQAFIREQHRMNVRLLEEGRC